MAALSPAWSPPHLAVATASSWLPRASASAPAFLPLTSRRSSPAPVRRIQFRSHCIKGPTEPEREGDEDAIGSSGNREILIQERMDKLQEEFRAALGLRTPPNMFRKEKGEISYIKQKMYSSSSDILNSNAKVMALTLCTKAQSALDLASEVMDVAAFGLGTTEISQSTADQMVRTHTTIFCEVTKDAYHYRVKMETILSFLGPCLGGFWLIQILSEASPNSPQLLRICNFKF